jgi:hypothetical protein
MVSREHFVNQSSRKIYEDTNDHNILPVWGIRVIVDVYFSFLSNNGSIPAAFYSSGALQHLWVDNIDRATRRKRQQLVESRSKIEFVAVLLDVPQVRGTDYILHV